MIIIRFYIFLIFIKILFKNKFIIINSSKKTFEKENENEGRKLKFIYLQRSVGYLEKPLNLEKEA